MIILLIFNILFFIILFLVFKRIIKEEIKFNLIISLFILAILIFIVFRINKYFNILYLEDKYFIFNFCVIVVLIFLCSFIKEKSYKLEKLQFSWDNYEDFKTELYKKLYIEKYQQYLWENNLTVFVKEELRLNLVVNCYISIANQDSIRKIISDIKSFLDKNYFLYYWFKGFVVVLFINAEQTNNIDSIVNNVYDLKCTRGVPCNVLPIVIENTSKEILMCNRDIILNYVGADMFNFIINLILNNKTKLF